MKIKYKPEINMAIKALRLSRLKIASSASAAVYGFRFGETAKIEYDKYSAAIGLFERILNGELVIVEKEMFDK